LLILLFIQYGIIVVAKVLLLPETQCPNSSGYKNLKATKTSSKLVNMKCNLNFLTWLIVITFLGFSVVMSAQDANPDNIVFDQQSYPLYPAKLDELPDIPSPFTTKDGLEVVLAFTQNEKYAIIPVTVEQGDPLLYSRRIPSLFGKDNQLHINIGDFPELAKTGLHSESQLNAKEMITGYPISLITYIGRPGKLSSAGFMADDEDIISVLKGDNNLVRKLGLTHPQMAHPLFQIWNIILKEMEVGNWQRFWKNITYVNYNKQNVFIEASGSKGWQVSIFQDEIQGRFNLCVRHELTNQEESFLQDQYAHLTDEQLTELKEKLSVINFSEMLPYYIKRYGFYEGHTDYRCDPIAIAFVFGMKNIEELDDAFQQDLYQVMTKHFISGDGR